MSKKEVKPPTYVEHLGTIRVAGTSVPRQVAQAAQALIARGVEPIDFFFIGGNAGQQANKAITILTYQIGIESNDSVTASFAPLRVMTMTEDAEHTSKEKDASVWRLLLTQGQFTSKVLHVTPENETGST